jgi:FlaA1/EpsC-like NDP-sugar epimerase
VVATADLLKLSVEIGVEHFVYPSSDKSVAPPSVYGATKRIAESLAQRHQRTVVRYVNIIGTRGSVIEIFSNQVRAERPLSVTDRRMTRYWISMDEALWSLLMGGQLGQPGQVLMPDCGEPVPLLDTIQRLASWYRPDLDPYPITITGMAPGERLHEVLLSGNEFFRDGPARGVRVVETQRPSERLEELRDAVGELHELAREGQRERLKERCLDLAEALQ